MMLFRTKHLIMAAALAFGAGTGASAWAAGDSDYYDTEIFFGGAAEGDTVHPNILFLFDTSGSMDTNVPAVGKKRLEIVQDAITEILERTSNIKAGLGRYSQPGGAILYPVKEIDEPADAVASSSISLGSDDAEENSVGVVDTGSTTLEIASSSNLVGLRFASLGIPQGAIVTEAKLLFNAYKETAGATAFTIHGHKLSDAATFSTANKISTRAKTTASTTWAPGTWTDKGAYSADITGIVQEIVNQSAWCGGNAMSFVLNGSSGRRDAYSYERDSTLAPRLVVKFDSALPAGANGCYTGVVVKQVSGSKNDVEELSNGDILTNSSDLDLLYDAYYGSNQNAVGIRVQKIQVPKGATILDAYLFFNSMANKTSSINATVHAVDSANAAEFGTAKNSLSTLPVTSGVSWSLGSWASSGQYNSPSITSLVQSIVDKSDWAYANNMAFVIKGGTSGKDRRAYTYDEDSSLAAGVYIKWKGTYQGTTVRDALKYAVADFKATGNTPISDTLAEGARYYRGETVYYGRERGSPHNREKRISHPDSYTGGSLYTPPGCTSLDPNSSACTDEQIQGTANYISPIEDDCQSNHIVFLTDGEPTSHATATSTMVNTWTGSSCPSNDQGEQCTRDIAKFLHTKDQSSKYPGTQTVTTHAIGFAEDSPFLKDVARNYGGGEYYYAYNTESLIEAFAKIISSISRVNTTFVSAGVAVNQLNRLTHRDELYFAMFAPEVTPKWPGNLKRYRLLNGEIVDKVPAKAVETTGFFKATAQSFWLQSATPDGDATALGGAAEHLDYADSLAETTVYTDVSGNTITATNNRVHEDNTNITSTLLATTDALRASVLQWARNVDVDSTESPKAARHEMGDPLHSRPNVVGYRDSDGNISNYVFVATNHGFLHAVDTDTGESIWQFIPKSLLKLLSVFKTNSGEVKHPHGFDGQMTIRIDDANNDGVVDAGKDKAYLYIGMRRGGSMYYALDITDVRTPAVKFTISPSDTGFDKLGETWSKASVGFIKLDGERKKVIVFGGGYDGAHSMATYAAPKAADSMGNNVYMADADTGALVWSAKENAMDPVFGTSAKSNMTHAIPADPAVFDLTGSGLIEHLYVADLGGQVFRFDFKKNAKNAGELATGGRIAHLAGTDQVGNRRFYGAPDVAYIKRQLGDFVSVSLGSGYREHPLDTVTNEHFYSLRDYGVLRLDTPEFDADIELKNLLDVTNLVGPDVRPKIEKTEAKYKGWYISFDNLPESIRHDGEKVLSGSLTFNNIVIFSTYSPDSASSECAPEIGSSRVYAVSVYDGNQILSDSETVTEADRLMTGATDIPGLSPAPMVVYDDQGVSVLVGSNIICASGSECSNELESHQDPYEPGGRPFRRNMRPGKWHKETED